MFWLIVLVVSLLLLVGAVWFFRVVRDTGGDGISLAPVTSTKATGTKGQSRPGEPDSSTAASQACRTLWESSTSALAAAAVTLKQWRAHVAAQVEFNAGNMTANQAKAQWAASKQGAAENSAAFEQAIATHQARLQVAESGELCAGEAAGDPAAQIQTCAQGLATHQFVLDAALTAHAGWKKHQAEMAAATAGDMARVDELASWQTLWREGQANLAVYDERLAKTASATCPLAGDRTKR